MATSTDATALSDLTVNHVEFYVEDVIVRAAELVERYGFQTFATSGALSGDSDHFSVALRQNGVVLVLTEPRSDRHRGHAYLDAHGEGVADIALRTSDAAAAFRLAVTRGAQPALPSGDVSPGLGAGPVIHGFGDVLHTFVEAPAAGSASPDGGSAGSADGIVLPGFPRIEQSAPHPGLGLVEVDHFAVCLPAGQLAPAVSFYESVLGFRMVFEERIVVGSQAMLSQVVQNDSRSVTLTLIQPDPAADPGQIDEFVDRHCGAGVQHIAFRTEDVVRAVSALCERGVEFLATPGAYYDLLARRLTLAAHTVDDLRRLDVLVDQDHDGQLFQIFTRSTHPRRTFFLEIIERLGARTFGSGNIKALYEAVEAEREQAGALS